MMKQKPIQVKPMFYAHCFETLKVIAKKYGYNLVLHGSMKRDLDLIAIPWIDNPIDEFKMIQAFDRRLTGKSKKTKQHYLHNTLPGGRKSYVINLNREVLTWKPYKDVEWYIDISVTPLLISTK